ncbi:MAG: hypothetical protein J3Q66DRAFT_5442 [Benniella sp.]|nr:MAG: hypothetical protein J3Q66DRAFT_5442 [Benniella sp.]
MAFTQSSDTHRTNFMSRSKKSIPFTFSAEGRPGPENDAIVFDLIRKLNKVVQEYQALDGQGSGSQEVDVKPLPWTKISSSLGQPTEVCIHIWRTFGDGQSLNDEEKVIQVKEEEEERKERVLVEDSDDDCILVKVVKPATSSTKDAVSKQEQQEDSDVEIVSTFKPSDRRRNRPSPLSIHSRATTFQSKNNNHDDNVIWIVDDSEDSAPSTPEQNIFVQAKVAMDQTPDAANRTPVITNQTPVATTQTPVTMNQTHVTTELGDESTRNTRTRMQEQADKLAVARARIDQVAREKEQQTDEQRRALDAFIQSLNGLKLPSQVGRRPQQRTATTLGHSTTTPGNEHQPRKRSVSESTNPRQEPQHRLKTTKSEKSDRIAARDRIDCNTASAPAPPSTQHQRQHQRSSRSSRRETPVQPGAITSGSVAGRPNNNANLTQNKRFKVEENKKFTEKEMHKRICSLYARRALRMDKRFDYM